MLPRRTILFNYKFMFNPPEILILLSIKIYVSNIKPGGRLRSIIRRQFCLGFRKEEVKFAMSTAGPSWWLSPAS